MLSQVKGWREFLLGRDNLQKKYATTHRRGMSVIEAHAVEQALPFAPVISERKGSIDDAKKVRFKDFIDA